MSVIDVLIREINRGIVSRAVLRIGREDGLVDGGTIDHVHELQAAQRSLHEALDPVCGSVR